MSLAKTLSANLDINNNNIPVVGEFVQSDTGSCYIRAKILQDSKAFDLTGLNIMLVIKKSDNKIVVQDYREEDSGITIIDAVTGEILIQLKTQSIASAGYTQCEIKFLEKGKILSTSRFAYNVRASLLSEDAIKSTDSIQALDKITTETANLNNEIQSNEEIRKINEDDRVIKESERVINEDDRKQSETTRKTNEDKRESEFARIKKDNTNFKSSIDQRQGTLESRYNEAIGALTVDGELIDMRIDNKGKTYTTAGEHLRFLDTQMSDIIQDKYTRKKFTRRFNPMKDSEGGSATIERVEGLTLVNPLNNGVNYANWIVDSGSSKGANGIHLVQNGVSEFARVPIDLKPNATYTLIRKNNSNTLTGNVVILGDGFLAGGNNKTLSKQLGIIKETFITASIITHKYLELRLDGANSNGDYIDFEVYAVLEDDETDLEITKPLKFGINSSLIRNIKTLSKNLFDKNNVFTYSPQLTITHIENGIRITNIGGVNYQYAEVEMKEFKKNTNHIISFDKNDIGVGITYIAIKGNHDSSETILSDKSESGSYNFNTGSYEKMCVRFYMSLGENTPSKTEFTNIMIVEGTEVPKEYIKHDKHVEMISKDGIELNCVNDIPDAIEQVTVIENGKSVSRNAVILRNKDIDIHGNAIQVETSSSVEGIYRIKFKKSDLSIPNNVGRNVGCNFLVMQDGVQLVSKYDWVDNYILLGDVGEWSEGNVLLFLDKTKIDNAVGSTLVEKANNYLQANPIVGLYNTIEEFYTVEVLKDFNNKLKAFKDGYMQIEYEGVCPEVTVKYAINIAAVRESMADMTKTNADQINNIWDAFYLITKEIQALK